MIWKQLKLIDPKFLTDIKGIYCTKALIRYEIGTLLAHSWQSILSESGYYGIR